VDAHPLPVVLSNPPVVVWTHWPAARPDAARDGAVTPLLKAKPLVL